MSERRAWELTLALVGLVTLARIAALFASALEFYPDEAQYWFWSTTPDFGYFSKPPMIAWLIDITTAVCGDGEACVRLSSPLLHGATALLIFAIGRLLYDARIGLWSAAAYLTLPGISYSAGIISTDVPLLFFHAVALFALLRALAVPDDGPRTMWAALCGAAIGLGMLSKYAMLYFVLGMVLAAVFHPPLRRLLTSRQGLIIAAVACVVFSPNIVWNAQHQFATVGHTASNADWQWQHAFNFAHLGDFVAGQFGVFGPVLMTAYLYGVWCVIRGRNRSATNLLLLAFSAPPLAIIIVQSFIAEANANWAAVAYIAATPFAVNALLTLFPRWAFVLSYMGTAIAAFVMMVFLISPAAVTSAGLANAYKRLHGWADLGREVVATARRGDYTAIVSQNRSVTAELLYYARPRAVPVLIWDRDADPRNHFDIAIPLTPAQQGRVLLVLGDPASTAVLDSFGGTRLIRAVTTPLGSGILRVSRLYDARAYRGR